MSLFLGTFFAYRKACPAVLPCHLHWMTDLLTTLHVVWLLQKHANTATTTGDTVCGILKMSSLLRVILYKQEFIPSDSTTFTQYIFFETSQSSQNHVLNVMFFVQHALLFWISVFAEKIHVRMMANGCKPICLCLPGQFLFDRKRGSTVMTCQFHLVIT